VPGDIVVLSAGDMIPADLRLLSARDLFVGQAAMTGEALPVEKFVTRPAPPWRARWSSPTSPSWAPMCSAARPGS
jgi:magnesium-transporting ATPase (P-type)